MPATYDRLLEVFTQAMKIDNGSTSLLPFLISIYNAVSLIRPVLIIEEATALHLPLK